MNSKKTKDEEVKNLIDLGKYQIRQLDPLNVVLERKADKSTTIVAYCNNVMSALKTYVEVAMNTEKKWSSIEDVTKALLEINKTLSAIKDKLG